MNPRPGDPPPSTQMNWFVGTLSLAAIFVAVVGPTSAAVLIIITGAIGTITWGARVAHEQGPRHALAGAVRGLLGLGVALLITLAVWSEL